MKLDLKTDKGRDALLALIDSADVLIENYRPQVMSRLDLGYDVLAARNPRLIYVARHGVLMPRSDPDCHIRTYRWCRNRSLK